MKRSQLLAVSVLALMLVMAVPAQVGVAQSSYTEKMTVYIAGSDALWYLSFGGVNGSSHLAALESTPGLSWYNITAIRTSTWSTDFQMFGPKGYNLLPVPFTPPQGLFLTLGSDSYADASAAASSLNSYFLTSFVSLANGSSSYTFYSPITFDTLVPLTLLKFVPNTEGGFAKTITSNSLDSSAGPFITLSGVKGASGFDHGLLVGSITQTALDSLARPNILGYFGSSPNSLQASSHSTSSAIQINVLDGVVSSTDHATVTSDNAKFTGSYGLTLAPGKGVTKINATIVQSPPALLATRQVDVGVLRTNDTLAVTLILRNLSPTATITSVKFNDSWWSSGSSFKFLSGNYTVKGSLAGGARETPVYRVQYIGTTTGSFTIPASAVRYQYKVNGITFNATAVLNPIRLSLGADDAVVYAVVTPLGSYGQKVGGIQKFNVTLTNVGTLPASSVEVSGQSISGLAGRSGGVAGGSATVTVSQSALGFIGVNRTTSYVATYQDPAGTSLNATTNFAPSVFSHTTMSIGFPSLTTAANVKFLTGGVTNLNLTFTTANSGPHNVTAFKATGILPSGLGCGTTGGKGITCTAGTVAISYRVVNASQVLKSSLDYNLTSPQNLLIGALAYSGSSAGFNMTGISNPVDAPGGLVVSKSYSPAELFGGMTSQVKVTALNSGPLPYYNTSLTTSVDSFDTLASTGLLAVNRAQLEVGASSNFTYSVTTSQVSGNLSGTAAVFNFFFGGTAYSIGSSRPIVNMYQTPTASISTYPATPEEGKKFTINFEITNPSGVPVTNVQFTLPVPSGLSLSNLQNAQVSGGALTIDVASLGPHSSANASASAVASSGTLIPFTNAKLTFSYAGANINGVVPSSSGIGIAEDVTTRYLIPTGLIILALVATAFYVRRMAGPSARASQK